MSAVFPLDPETLIICPQYGKERGASIVGEYQTETPYHYICVDNFLPNEIIERVREEVPEHSSAYERLKTSYNPNRLPNCTSAVSNALNSRFFKAEALIIKEGLNK